MFDGLSLRQDIGPVVWPLEPEKVAVRFGEIPQADVDALVAAEKAKYTVEMEPALFERSARLALALESVVKEHRFDAFSAFDQVWLTDPRVGIIPSYGTGRLCEIGIPAAPEGDVNTAVAQLILQELAGTATTLENYVIDFDNEAVMFCHDGHGNPAMGTPGAVKVKHSIYYQGVHGFGAGFEFAYEPGPITNLALVTVGESRWRFVISEGELLPFPPRAISAPQTLFRHDTLPIAEWCDAWCQAGATHHMGAARGRWTSQLLAPRPDARHRGGRRVSDGRADVAGAAGDTGRGRTAGGRRRARSTRLRPPVFEIGLKGYMLGRRGRPPGRGGGPPGGRAGGQRRLRPAGRGHPGRRPRDRAHPRVRAAHGPGDASAAGSGTCCRGAAGGGGGRHAAQPLGAAG